MSRAFSFVAVAVVGVALAAPAWAQEDQQSVPEGPRQVQVELSGYSFNINQAGTNGVQGFVVAEAKTTLGLALATGTNGTLRPPSPSGPFPEWCPQQLPLVVYLPIAVAGDIGLRFRSGGDLLLVKGVPAAGVGLCIHKNADLTGGWYEGRGAGTVVSGTGRFEGVSGTFESRYGGRFFTPTFSDTQSIFEMTLRIDIDR